MPKPKSRNASQAAPKSSSSSKMKARPPPDKNNNNPSGSKESKKSKDYEKYSLRPRSIQNRIETEKRQKGELKKEPKPKHKPPPLSKYRRKTANARERSRMREINTAYELLQSTVPQYPVLPTNAQGKTCEKLTKITTLRLAMKYIQSLKTLLKEPSSSSSSAASPSSTTSSLLSAAGLGGSINCIDIESDTDSIGNSMHSSSASSISSCGSSASSNASNCSGSASEFSPASSYAMSPMSSCSPVGPDCIQTVMRSVVSPAAAAAISANAANLNNLNLNNVSLSSLTSSPGSLGIVAPHQSITTIVTIPSHPHAQAQYSRQLPPTVHHHHHHQQLQNQNQTQPLHQQQAQLQPQHLHHQLHTFPPPPRPPSVTSSSSTYMTPPAMTPSAILIQPQLQHHHQLQQLKPLSQQPIHITTLPIANLTSSQNPLLCSPQASIVNSISHNQVAASAHSQHNHHHQHKTKLPPIATTLSSALLRKSMSSFLTDCIQLTNGVNVSMNNIISCNNNGNRTGSLSSLTESDLSEYTNDLLSDEGSVLDEPMFEDIIGVGATDLDLLLGTDSENLGFSTADLSAI